MSHKILLADDSLTIQKVIKITLANEAYEIDVCASEKDLEKDLKSHDYAIVLLDFSFSESVDGYELAKKIKSLSPSSKLIMLYGTFDTIEEDKLAQSGSDDKIVKPFDSTKFIALCREMVSNQPSVEEDEWVVESQAESMPEPIAPKVEKIENDNQNILSDELTNWGFEVPSIIGGEKEVQKEFPGVITSASRQVESSSYEEIRKRMMEPEPVMEEEVSSDADWLEDDQDLTEEISDETNPDFQIPSDTDLEYPEDIQLEAKPRLVSADQLNEPLSEEQDLSSFEDSDSALEEQVYDDELSDDFWAIDEDNEEKTADTLTASVNQLSDEVLDKIEKNLEAELKEQISPLVEKIVRECCQETVEKIAWELMPDLAENLIKKELSRISDSVLNN